MERPVTHISSVSSSFLQISSSARYFLNTLSLCSALNMTDRATHLQHYDTGKIIRLHVLIFLFEVVDS